MRSSNSGAQFGNSPLLDIPAVTSITDNSNARIVLHQGGKLVHVAAGGINLANLQGANTFTGENTFNGETLFNGNVGVDANLIVSGTSTLQGAVDIDSTLNVDGTAAFNDTVTTNEIFRLTRVSSLTVATGAITVTGSYHSVDTEAAAATDDLDTINGAVGDGHVLIIRPVNSARDIVVKNGTGNISCRGGADITLGTSATGLMLVYNGATWMANT